MVETYTHTHTNRRDRFWYDTSRASIHQQLGKKVDCIALHSVYDICHKKQYYHDDGDGINTVAGRRRDNQRYTPRKGRRDASFFSIRAKSQWSRRETEKTYSAPVVQAAVTAALDTHISYFPLALSEQNPLFDHLWITQTHFLISLRRRRRQQVSFDITPKLDYFYPSPFLCELYIDFIRWWRNDITNSCL